MGSGRVMLGETPASETQRIYYARAIDGESFENELRATRTVRLALGAIGLTLIDPVAIFRARPGFDLVSATPVVEADLDLLRGASAVLMNMTIPDRNYIGCVCELVYASLWNIPTVVIVGSTDYGERIWLRHHATAIVETLAEATTELQHLLER